jgi:hypothetical protein
MSYLAIEIGEEADMDQVPQELVYPPRVSSQEKPGQGPDLPYSSHTETTLEPTNNSVHLYGATDPFSQDVSSQRHAPNQYQDQQRQQQYPQTSTARGPSPTQSPFSDNEEAPSQIRSPPPEPTDGSDSEEVVLPPNWSATTNSKGRLYYYNIITKETSWKMPSAHNSPSTHSDPFARQQYDHQMEVLDQEFNSTAEEPLPEGWNSAQGNNEP